MKNDPAIKFPSRHVSVSMTVKEWLDVILSLVTASTAGGLSEERQKMLLDEAKRISERVEALRTNLFDDIVEPGELGYRQGGFTKARPTCIS